MAGLSTRAFAAAAPLGRQIPGASRFKVGDLEVTALDDGQIEFPLEGFVANAPIADVRKALAERFLPAERPTIAATLTTLVVNTGKNLVLIDTGAGGWMNSPSGTLLKGFAAAGLDPAAVDTVLISHFHPDHVFGLRRPDGTLTFANAEIKVPAADWAFWMDESLPGRMPEGMRGMVEQIQATFRPNAKDVARFDWNKEVAAGIESVAADGHTPGHTAFHIGSGDSQLMVMGDTAGTPALFVRHPEWQFLFDIDRPKAVETRKRMLDMVATDRIRVAGYHFPFPANGYIVRDGTGFDFMPAPWQPVL